ncbi:MAG: hypothetical protein OXU71_03225 [Gammaproteobacteria bacterium]|nr:hypothetical protein [Gammaproteobacteria bacterium]
MRGIVEDDLEQATLGWLGELGYTVVHGRSIVPGETVAAAGQPGDRRIGALDDKIELNRRMNKTLEAMAAVFAGKIRA